MEIGIEWSQIETPRNFLFLSFLHHAPKYLHHPPFPTHFPFLETQLKPRQFYSIAPVIALMSPSGTMGKSNPYGGDLELGRSGGALYPNMVENPQLRWAFIRKVYSILTFQLLITVIVAAVFNFVPAIQDYFHMDRNAAIGCMVGAMVLEFILLMAMYFLKDRHPLNIFLLLLFTLSSSVVIGLVCLFASGKLVLQAAVVTVVVFLSLTLYTFWAAKKGYDFSFLSPFLFAAIITLLIFSIVQIFFPLGKTVSTVIAGVAVIIFCGFIIYDTDNIIKRFSYDDYIIASVDLYLDIINLFLYLLQIFSNLE